MICISSPLTLPAALFPLTPSDSLPPLRGSQDQCPAAPCSDCLATSGARDVEGCAWSHSKRSALSSDRPGGGSGALQAAPATGISETFWIVQLLVTVWLSTIK